MLSNGDVFAEYVIERQLGRGGMGSVYLAKHPRLPRMTALKLLNREMVFDKEVRARFEREADLVAQLDHHNIVTVYDRGLEDGQMWISMQYIDGVDAASVNPLVLPPERAVQIIAEVGDALDYAHRNEVLHRDVKPANILLARSTGGKGERVYLTDFGIARLRDDQGQNLTQTGTFTATLAYASPEQLTGSALDGRSDQYSLACTLFWLLTGAGPFSATNPAAVIQGHLQNPPPPLSSARPGLPPSLDLVLAKAMAKRPDERFPSCSEFAAAARRALASPSAPAMPLVGRTAPPMPIMGQGPTAGPMTAGQLPTGMPMPTGGHMHTGGQPMPTAGSMHTAPPNPTANAMPYQSGPQVNTATPPPQPVAGTYTGRATNPQFTPPGNAYTRPSGPVPPGTRPPGVNPMAGGRPPMPPKKSNAGLIIAIVVGVLVLAVVALIGLAAIGSDSGSGSSGSSAPSGSGTAKNVDWSSLSKEFPRMVPTTKTGELGYNSANCYLYESSSPPEKSDGEPDFGDWSVQWICSGGGDYKDPFYRLIAYPSSAKAQAVVDGLVADKKSQDTNGGKTYTNYQFTDNNQPRLVTAFTGDANRSQYLMYTDGVYDSMDDVLRWWRSAPLN